jgi:hypothetical protein
MIRASIALLVLCLIAIGVLSTYSERDGGTMKFSGRDRTFGRFAEADLPPHDSSHDKPTPLPAALLEDPQLNEAWHYTEYGERSAAEPVDPDWAPQMEATLDSLIRSMGSPVGDVKEVECRTTKCRAVVLLQPSLFLMEEEERNEAIVAFFDEFNRVMEPVIEASTRFTKTTGVALVQISEERPYETNIWDTVGAFLYVAGMPLGDSPF